MLHCSNDIGEWWGRGSGRWVAWHEATATAAVGCCYLSIIAVCANMNETINWTINSAIKDTNTTVA